ncbi:cardiolipin synthetase [Xanthomonas translucens pv. graminis]|uniref:Cardiolipin synthase n=1 Tax=Xanthomonas graminis pv. graminis TaxID=134874 RepID=A0A1M4KZA1_9XANT|nr:cardiolipin synthase family enzyme [Xanthomonas translucens pv. graminis ART-Xtg29]SBV38490.1 cardiolipin synthetase [Xanthomonas translucens pv. graminis]SBV38589.1 cardiolipin synthetase [Xanthomonas translucens pv. graminis]SBV45454.1 cardiolipin synthetase [Xanthomonas translucens pv. graminis ART-Xtg29]SBV53449.1 cardiolipin synthetase [Xanthomonas translucens pv. graminis]
MPVLGLPLYLLLGHPWLSRERVQRQAQASQVIREQQQPLSALRWTPPADTAIAEVVPLIERQGDFMPTHGNTVELLDRYADSLQALIDDIDAAVERVHLLYYLMFDDAVGDAVVAALLRAAARGVRCRLLLDARGGKRGLRRYRKCLRAAGVEVQALLPGGLRWRRSGRMDLRNHRKIAVIDNRVGYTGSQNLAAAEFVRGHPNRELVVRLQGPVVGHLEAVFASDWFIETGQRLRVADGTAVHGADTATQLLPSGPAYPFENARDAVNALIHLARRRIVMVTPYFVPDEATLSALRIAALSGVDVQLILSESSNQRLTAWAQEAYYDELLRSGVKIALYRPCFLHAKHLSVDEGIALVGSINLDIRSFALNAEIGVLCYCAEVVQRLRAVEADYLADARALSLQEWRKRPTWRRSREGIARLADALM